MPFNKELLEKRKQLLESGVNPYPYSFDTSHTISEVRAKQVSKECLMAPTFAGEPLPHVLGIGALTISPGKMLDLHVLKDGFDDRFVARHKSRLKGWVTEKRLEVCAESLDNPLWHRLAVTVS